MAEARKGKKRRQNKMVLTPALTCILSPRGEDITLPALSDLINRPTNPTREIPKTQRTLLPLRGERAGVREGAIWKSPFPIL
jgi:hypothetical protein